MHVFHLHFFSGKMSIQCFCPSNFHSWVCIKKKNPPLIKKDTCTPMFIAALFIIAKSASNLSVNQQMNRWRKTVYTYSALPWWLIQQGICLQCGRPRFILGSGISLGNGNDYSSSILAWRISRTEEPGQLQSTGSQRVRHD